MNIILLCDLMSCRLVVALGVAHIFQQLYLQEVSLVKYTLNAEDIPDPVWLLWLSPRLRDACDDLHDA